MSSLPKELWTDGPLCNIWLLSTQPASENWPLFFSLSWYKDTIHVLSKAPHFRSRQLPLYIPQRSRTITSAKSTSSWRLYTLISLASPFLAATPSSLPALSPPGYVFPYFPMPLPTITFPLLIFHVFFFFLTIPCRGHILVFFSFIH